MIGRISGVAQVQDIGIVSSAKAYRSPLIPAIETNSLTVDAATLGLPHTVGVGARSEKRRSHNGFSGDQGVRRCSKLDLEALRRLARPWPEVTR